MYGHHVHEAVLASGAKLSGATVHFVTPETDMGPIILQAAVPVLDTDTPDCLAARVLRSSIASTRRRCASLPRAAAVEGNRVRILKGI